MPGTVHSSTSSGKTKARSGKEQRIHYKVSRLRKRDIEFTAISDEMAEWEGFRLIKAKRPYTLESFMEARGVSIIRVSDGKKIYPKEH